MIALTLSKDDVILLENALDALGSSIGRNEELTEEDRNRKMGMVASLWDKVMRQRLTHSERFNPVDSVKWNRYPDVLPADGAVCIVTIEDGSDVRVMVAEYKAHKEGLLASYLLAGFYTLKGHSLYNVVGWYVPQPMVRVAFSEVSDD